MGWTTPKTWADEDPFTAAILNTHIRDNLADLKSDVQALEGAAGGTRYYKSSVITSNLSLSSTSWADISGISFNMTVTAGDVWKFTFFIGYFQEGRSTDFDLIIDNTHRNYTANGLDGWGEFGDAESGTHILVDVITNLAAGTRAIKMRYKAESGQDAAAIRGDRGPAFLLAEKLN